MKPDENYTPGYTINASQFMAQRSARTHAAFLLPHLRAGMRVLDCGCGPGSITLDFAERIAPGMVTGLDQEGSQIELARAAAIRRSLVNVEFLTGSIYELPFPADTFDIVWAHAVFEHLREPVSALREIGRVLKPGGHIALRSPDWGGFLIHPMTAELREAIEFYQQVQKANGGDVQVGRKFKSLLAEAGFDDSRFSASYECYPTLPLIGEYLAQRLDRLSELERQGKLPTEVSGYAQALRAWMQAPDGVFAQAWCEVIGIKC